MERAPMEFKAPIFDKHLCEGRTIAAARLLSGFANGLAVRMLLAGVLAISAPLGVALLVGVALGYMFLQIAKYS